VQICRQIIDTVRKFAPGINNTSGTGDKICPEVVDTCRKFVTGVGYTGGTPSLPNFSANVKKKLKWAWGKMIHEKNLKQKIF
jgi:hypothetical protein